MMKNVMNVAMTVMGMTPLSLFAQEAAFTLKGKLQGAEAPAKVFLYYNKVRDSATVENGRFTLKGKIAEPAAATLLLEMEKPSAEKGRDMRRLYLEKGKITITGAGTVATAKVSGGAVNRDYVRLQQQLEPVLAKRKALSAAAAQKAAAALEEERKAVLAAFIRANPNTIVSLDAIKDYGGFMPDAGDVAPLFNVLSTRVKATAQGKEYAATLAKLKATAIGAMAPAFEKKDPAGKTVKLSDYRGKYVLVDFWASWCKPCRAENPHLVKAYEKYQQRGFDILGVSLDVENLRSAWLKAIADDELTWTQVIDLGEEKASDLYGIQAIPQNFLVDPEGKIIAKNLRGGELEDTLTRIFK